MIAFRVRQAAIQDLDSLTELFDEYRVFYGTESDPAGAREFLWNRFEHNESVVYLAEETETGRAAGFAQLYPSFSSVSMRRIWILNDLYVRESYRGRGVGGSLLESVREYAVLTKAKRVELTTAATNRTAQRLYENNGYELEQTFLKYWLTV
ncbi:N-acetyltransferase [Cohnella xylanilytica]|uniref:GNAT family N-acetyltransferase n=1 Tax=Cohnella xylanilytica TaxID=557555 RepID=UPI001B2307B2|nr:GNAT family N-acetyltransferase [Cohnella xylanilytica]GIO16427.1 N-acetyltransferase [Cohnella xylanilytica]